MSDQVCKNCGKLLADGAGTFTSFLFKNLRCQCANSATSSSETRARQKRSSTAYRTAQRKQFTKNTFASRFSEKIKGSGQREVLTPGTVIGGTFKIIDVIGEGGMGVVYSAEQTALKRSFALKILSPDLVNEQTWKRFQAEAKMLAGLSHATLVKVYDLGIHDHSLPFYSMDLLTGRTLERILADEGALELDEAFDIFLKLLDGLAYAHSHNIIHRDLKPANIMVSFAADEAEVKILDFGISKLLSAKGDDLQNLTMAGEVFGSPFYMSPEQCVGGLVDARSDIYSVGCSLFETLTTCVPFEGANSVETVSMHEQEKAPSLNDVCGLNFPDSVEYVVAKCLAKEPADRYQTAADLASDLARIQLGQEADYFHAGTVSKTISGKKVLTAEGRSFSWSGFWQKYALYSIAISALLAGVLASFYIYQHLGVESDVDKEQDVHRPNTSEETDSQYIHNQDNSERNSIPENENTEFFSRPLPVGDTIQFDFPQQAIGIVNNNFKSSTGFAAQGRVNFKLKEHVFFFTNDYLVHHPALLKGFRPADLYAFVVSEQVDDKVRMDKVMPYVAKLSGLRSLSLDNTRYNDDLIDYINRLPNLETLSLNNCEITAAGVKKFKNLKRLHDLDYCYNKGVSEILAALANSDQIYALSLEAPEKNLTDSDIKNILSLKRLKRINLVASGVSGQMLLKIASMPELKYVDVSGCMISTDSINRVHEVNPGLEIHTL